MRIPGISEIKIRSSALTAPATASAAEARVNEGYECTDWYFCKKEL